MKYIISLLIMLTLSMSSFAEVKREGDTFKVEHFMGHERWSECIFCSEIEGHPCPDSTYMVPEDIYNEIYS